LDYNSKYYQHFIYGQFTNSHHQQKWTNINPATEEIIGSIEKGSKKEIDYAVAAGRRALDGPWKEYSMEERSEVLKKIGDLIMERIEELAYLEALDTGKPMKLAKELDIPGAAQNFHFYADFITSIQNEAYQDQGMFHYAHRSPVGVVGIINPWSMPLLLLGSSPRPW